MMYVCMCAVISVYHICTCIGMPAHTQANLWRLEGSLQESGVSPSFSFFLSLSHQHFFSFSFFIDTISSLILWEFHIMHPIILFPVFPCLLPPLPPPTRDKNNYKKRKKSKSNSCSLSTSWSMVQLSVAYPLNRTEYLSSCPPSLQKPSIVES